MYPSLIDEIRSDEAQKAWELSRAPEEPAPIPATCSHCSGTGKSGPDPEDTCDDCRGEGVRYV